MLLLLVRRRLEAADPDALRVDQADRVTQHAALARGVHALEDEQHPTARAGRAVGEQPLLQVGELGTQRGERGLALGLAAVEAGCGVGLDRGQVHRSRRRAQRRHGAIIADGRPDLDHQARPGTSIGPSYRPCPRRRQRVLSGAGGTNAPRRPRASAPRTVGRTAQPTTRRTSSVQPTSVATLPSGCGSSNQVPATNPSFSSTRRLAALRWSGHATVRVDVGVAAPGARQPGPEHVGPDPAPDQVGLADRVVDAHRLRVGRGRPCSQGGRAAGSPGRTRRSGR